MYRPGTRARVWVPLELLYTPAKNNITQRYWYELDGHGSVVALTGAAGNVVDSYAYDAWGRPTASSAAGAAAAVVSGLRLRPGIEGTG